MARKSNKTSHVLNLLTSGPSEPVQPAAASSESGSKSQGNMGPGKITVVDEANTNEKVSKEILKGLTRELGKEQKTGEIAQAGRAAEQEERTFCFVNVMEDLVRRQDLDKYLADYQVCRCSRCRADVCALALSRLPAKYIVTDANSLPLLLSYYGSYYRVPILTQLVRACIEVREHPRHESPAIQKSRSPFSENQDSQI